MAASTLKYQRIGPDHIWRGVWVCNGYEIRATLDLGATERLARIGAGISEMEPVEIHWLSQWLANVWAAISGAEP